MLVIREAYTRGAYIRGGLYSRFYGTWQSSLFSVNVLTLADLVGRYLIPFTPAKPILYGLVKQGFLSRIV